MSDKGFGKFGTNEWHTTQINGMDDPKKVCWYVFKLTDVVIKPLETLDKTKEKALKLIRVH